MGDLYVPCQSSRVYKEHISDTPNLTIMDDWKTTSLFGCYIFKHCIHLKFNIAPENRPGPNRKVFFKPIILQRWAVKLRGCWLLETSPCWWCLEVVFWIGYVAMPLCYTIKTFEANGITSNEVSIPKIADAYGWKKNCWSLNMFVETFQDEQIHAFFWFLLKLNAVSQTSHVFCSVWC